jgi:hypothetical protein
VATIPGKRFASPRSLYFFFVVLSLSDHLMVWFKWFGNLVTITVVSAMVAFQLVQYKQQLADAHRREMAESRRMLIEANDKQTRAVQDKADFVAFLVHVLATLLLPTPILTPPAGWMI